MTNVFFPNSRSSYCSHLLTCFINQAGCFCISSKNIDIIKFKLDIHKRLATNARVDVLLIQFKLILSLIYHK